MGKENIDASLGLEFSLALFERYRKNGLLHAEIQHVPGIRGRCKGFLHLNEGIVVKCYIEDRHGQHHSTNQETLARVDKEHGPFEWALSSNPAPISQHSRTDNMPFRATQYSPVPETIAPLDLKRLASWPTRQKLMLSIVYDLIDGVRNIEEIKFNSLLPPDVTEDALRILLSMKSIIIPVQM